MISSKIEKLFLKLYYIRGYYWFIEKIYSVNISMVMWFGYFFTNSIEKQNRFLSKTGVV